MTGELHLEKPSVEQEVQRGLHFFDETLFEMAPKMLTGFELALKHAYPDTRFDVPPFFQFGSWIGGDRDGNPFVTTSVTRTALKQNALASLRHYRARIVEPCPLSVHHRARLAGAGRLPRRACPRAGGERRCGRHPRPQSRRGLSPIPHRRAAQARRHHRPHRGQWRRRGAPLLRQCRRADPRSPRAGERAGGGKARLDRHRSGAPGALCRAALPLLDRAPRSPREHHAHHRDVASVVARHVRAKRRRGA